MALALGAAGRGWIDRWRLVLVLAALWFLPAVYGRIGGDGNQYYILLRSPALDLDFDFANDFAGLGAAPVMSVQGESTSRMPIGTARQLAAAVRGRAPVRARVVALGRRPGGPTVSGRSTRRP